MKERCRLFYCDEYVYDVVESGRRHAFDIERPRKIRDALIASGAAAAASFHAPHMLTDSRRRSPPRRT